MPISLVNKRGTDLLEIVVSGKLTHEDYVQFAPSVERYVQAHGTIRVLLDMIDFHGWEPSALWDDTVFGFKHYSDITRIAMIGDHTWEKVMSTVCVPFTRAEIRYFDWKSLNEARAWLDEPIKQELREAASPNAESMSLDREALVAAPGGA